MPLHNRSARAAYFTLRWLFGEEHLNGNEIYRRPSDARKSLTTFSGSRRHLLEKKAYEAYNFDRAAPLIAAGHKHSVCDGTLNQKAHV